MTFNNSDSGAAGEKTALDRVSFVPDISPFQKAAQEWSAQQGNNLQLTNPRGCGLAGRINFKFGTITGLINGQFIAFWNSLPQELAAQYNEHRMGYRQFFTELAAATLQAGLIHGIESGKVPHPDGKKVGTPRAGKPGSLEDDCARALGGLRHDSATLLTEYLKNYAISCEADVQFIKCMSRYLGVGHELANELEARILNHYQKPNIYQARSFGQLLSTALQQVYGRVNSSTTPEKIINDQVTRWSWPDAYKKPPLLDEVLDWAFEYYNPSRVAEFYNEPHHQEYAHEAPARIAEAQAITLALHEFRARMTQSPDEVVVQVADGVELLMKAPGNN